MQNRDCHVASLLAMTYLPKHVIANEVKQSLFHRFVIPNNLLNSLLILVRLSQKQKIFGECHSEQSEESLYLGNIMNEVKNDKNVAFDTLLFCLWKNS